MDKSVWVLDLAKEVDPIKEFVGLVAEPLVVDELSLIKEEPVRVQARCRNPETVRGSIEIFFNGVGKIIKFEVEGGNQGSIKGGKGGLPPPGPGKLDDNSNKDRDKHHKGDQAKRQQGKFDRCGIIDKEMDSNHDDSMEEGMEELQGGGSDNLCVTPLAAFHPAIGMVEVEQYVSHKGEGEKLGSSERDTTDIKEYPVVGTAGDS